MSDRPLDRFNVQTTVLQCMQELDLDAMAYPTSNTPPEKLGSPNEGDGRRRTSSSSLGRQGFLRSACLPVSRRKSTTASWIPPQAAKDAEGNPGTKPRRTDGGALAGRHRLRGATVRRAGRC